MTLAFLSSSGKTPSCKDKFIKWVRGSTMEQRINLIIFAEILSHPALDSFKDLTKLYNAYLRHVSGDQGKCFSWQLYLISWWLDDLTFPYLFCFKSYTRVNMHHVYVSSITTIHFIAISLFLLHSQAILASILVFNHDEML